MNAGRTRRIQPRFRAQIPLLCESRGEVHTLIPKNISTSGCFFDFSRPEFLSDGTYNVKIPLDTDFVIEVKEAKLSLRRPHGFRFEWQLPAQDEARLLAYLQLKNERISTHAKVLFLVNEQKAFFQGFRDIAEQKQKGYRFLFGLIAAYCVYLSAPFHIFEIKSAEQLGFYGIGGFWASVILIYHCLRFLHWLGINVRRKALFVHAMAANRAWVFENDPSYYGKSVLPMGSRYDDARAWSPQSSLGLEELFPLSIGYRGSTTIFHFMVQSFFAFGMILLLSVFARSILDKSLDESAFAHGFRIFDARYFLATYSAASILLLGWVHSCGRAFAQYQRRVWEARRISSERPNPRFTGRGLIKEQPLIHKLSVGFVVVWVTYGVLAFFVALFASRLPTWIPEHLNSWITTTSILVFVLVGKIIYIKIQLKAETDLHKESLPLCDIKTYIYSVSEDRSLREIVHK